MLSIEKLTDYSQRENNFVLLLPVERFQIDLRTHRKSINIIVFQLVQVTLNAIVFFFFLISEYRMFYILIIVKTQRHMCARSVRLS